MAKQASLAKSETVKPAPMAAKIETKPAEDKPVATLVAPAPVEEPKRRGRPPGKSNGQGARKAKAAPADILFMVETEAGSERYEMRPIKTVTELFDLMDANRRLVATRAWREL